MAVITHTSEMQESTTMLLWDIVKRVWTNACDVLHLNGQEAVLKCLEDRHVYLPACASKRRERWIVWLTYFTLCIYSKWYYNCSYVRSLAFVAQERPWPLLRLVHTLPNTVCYCSSLEYVSLTTSTLHTHGSWYIVTVCDSVPSSENVLSTSSAWRLYVS